MKQKSIEQKIAEVQQYFINKLVEADFEIEDGDQFSLKVLVDGKYKFNIWIANGVDCISAQIGIGAVFMALPEFNSIQKKILYGKIEAEILKYTGIEHHRELLKIQIAELQSKIENLEL